MYAAYARSSGSDYRGPPDSAKSAHRVERTAGLDEFRRVPSAETWCSGSGIPDRTSLSRIPGRVPYPTAECFWSRQDAPPFLCFERRKPVSAQPQWPVQVFEEGCENPEVSVNEVSDRRLLDLHSGEIRPGKELFEGQQVCGGMIAAEAARRSLQTLSLEAGERSREGLVRQDPAQFVRVLRNLPAYPSQFGRAGAYRPPPISSSSGEKWK